MTRCSASTETTCSTATWARTRPTAGTIWSGTAASTPRPPRTARPPRARRTSEGGGESLWSRCPCRLWASRRDPLFPQPQALCNHVPPDFPGKEVEGNEEDHHRGGVDGFRRGGP